MSASPKNKLELEFESIERRESWLQLFQQIKGESMQSYYSVEEARKSCNKFLNRYRDVNPYDHTRVILNREDFDYINASYITVEEARRKYILTQGPLPNTVVHFWLMVWEQNCRAIIMLNKVIEKNQNKCSQYWPSTESDSSISALLSQVDLKLELLGEQDYSHYVVRNLRLSNTKTNESRLILHFHHTTWPDFGVPNSPLTFLKFLRDIRQKNVFNSDDGPPVVHCSAGIGRSGTFCLVDTCLLLMKAKGVENVSVKKVLVEMRKCRMGLIQTHEQLRFSYMAIIQGLKVDWDATNDKGMPTEMELKPPDLDLELAPAAVNDKLLINVKPLRDSDDENAPPPLPPRTQFESEKPLPITPGTDEDDVPGEVELTIAGNNLSGIRKRKCAEASNVEKRAEEAPQDESENSQEVKKKKADDEKWKIQRSLLTNFVGLSFVALTGAIVAYFYYRRL